VRHGRVGPTKGGRPRLVPLIEPLAKILAEWRLATGGAGQLFRPANPARGGRHGAPPRYLNLHTVHIALRKALRACQLPEALTLYECTRHTMASLYVMGGGSLERLQELLGHSSVLVTQKYAHLKPELFRPADLLSFTADLSRPGGEVIELAARRNLGRSLGAPAVDEDAPNGVSTALT
jgi:integrase